MSACTVVALLSGAIPTGEVVRVNGWVRSKRDSKAGISFVEVNDGSCFHSIQAVVPNTLSNYQSEVLSISTGCSVSITGLLVASVGKGQTVEIQAREVAVLGWVDDPESYPVAKKRHTLEYLRTVAHLRRIGARPFTAVFDAIGTICDLYDPQECWNDFKAAGYASS